MVCKMPEFHRFPIERWNPGIVTQRQIFRSMNRDGDAAAEVFPGQRERSLAVALIFERVFQVFNQRGRLFHLQRNAAQLLRFVVSGSPLAGLLVDEQHPVGRIGEINEECVIAFGNGQIAERQVGLGVQLGGGIGSGAPDGIGGIHADAPILAEELADAAFDTRGVVADFDGLAADGCGFRGRRAGDCFFVSHTVHGLLLSENGCCGDEKYGAECEMLHLRDLSLWGFALLATGTPQCDDCCILRGGFA